MKNILIFAVLFFAAFTANAQTKVFTATRVHHYDVGPEGGEYSVPQWHKIFFDEDMVSVVNYEGVVTTYPVKHHFKNRWVCEAGFVFFIRKDRVIKTVGEATTNYIAE